MIDEAKNADEAGLRRGFLTKGSTKITIHKMRKLLFYH
jgi:hypothetical protein